LAQICAKVGATLPLALADFLFHELRGAGGDHDALRFVEAPPVEVEAEGEFGEGARVSAVSPTFRKRRSPAAMVTLSD
jgi:hypothetical protein